MTFVKGRILCTEDDADSRDLLVCILENDGGHDLRDYAGKSRLNWLCTKVI